MELNHTFTVPAGPAETWAAFEDIESVAVCFPGASVTSVEGEEFKGTCKVKLGPIALTYAGQGRFVDKDQDAGRFVIEAKGKDKRGNGTASATVTATLAEDGSGTRVEVLTDLSITGKPAQFGRGVIQDVSDKLLQQFVTCLESKVGAPPEAPTAPEAPAVAEAPTAPAAPVTEVAEGAGAPHPADVAAAQGAAPVTPAPAREQPEALDLGATVLPVLAKAYWRQAAGALLALLLVVVVLRLRRRG